MTVDGDHLGPQPSSRRQTGAKRRTLEAEHIEAEVINATPGINRGYVTFIHECWYQPIQQLAHDESSNGFFLPTTRLIALAGALILPALTGITIGSGTPEWVPVVALVISVLVAIATALQRALRYGLQVQAITSALDQLMDAGRELYMTIIFDQANADAAWRSFACKVNQVRGKSVMDSIFRLMDGPDPSVN